MTEAEIQRWLFFLYGRHRLLWIPNCYYFCNESDVLTVTKNLYIDEYEIKLSRSDFLADQKKERWMLYRERPEYGRYGNKIRYPNRFWYVVPENLVGPDDIPDYAGLIYFPSGKLQRYQQVRAPKLHDQPLDIDGLQRLARNLSFKHWQCWLDKNFSEL